MPKYRVRIGNEEYVVEIEEIREISRARKVEKKLSSPVSLPIPPPTLPTPTKDKNTIVASMPGKVIGVHVKPGDIIRKNDVVITLVSMKTNVEIRSHIEGVVDEVYVKEGDVVKQGSPLVRVIPKSLASFGLDIADRLFAGMAILYHCRTPKTYDEIEKIVTAKFSIKSPGLKTLIATMKLFGLIKEENGKIMITKKGDDRYRELIVRLRERLKFIGMA